MRTKHRHSRAPPRPPRSVRRERSAPRPPPHSSTGYDKLIFLSQGGVSYTPHAVPTARCRLMHSQLCNLQSESFRSKGRLWIFLPLLEHASSTGSEQQWGRIEKSDEVKMTDSVIIHLIWPIEELDIRSMSLYTTQICADSLLWS